MRTRDRQSNISHRSLSTPFSEFIGHLDCDALVEFVSDEQNGAEGEHDADGDAGERVITGHGFWRGW